MSSDISCKIGNGRFQYRVGGVLIHDNKVLLGTDERIDFWALPGGRVSMFETSVQALQREIFEELGVTPEVKRLLWTAEATFSLWGCDVHEIALYYLIDFPENSPIYHQESMTGTEEIQDKKIALDFKWFALDTLASIDLKPVFLKRGLQNIPSNTEHLVIHELKKSN